jgi:type IV pilus assembly protein PilC
MKFKYRAFDKAGRLREEVIDAATPAEATDMLARQGLFVSELSQTLDDGSAAPRARSSLRFRRGPRGGKHKAVAGFLKHLSVLVATGTPVTDALEALERQARDEIWRGVIGDIRVRVEDGAPLSEALAAHPRYFDLICRSLVRAGESGGKLDVMLTRLAELTRKQVRIRQTLIGAMVYPCLLITVSVIVLVIMMCFVMPRFTGLFKTLDVPLPPTTRMLMNISEFAVGYWWAIVLVLGAMVSAMLWWLKTPGGRRALHGFLVGAPHLGRMFRGFATARFARLMGLLLDSRVPMLECLELTRDASANVHYIDLLSGAHAALTRGEPLSSAISVGGLIEPSVCEAVRNGERTGQIGPVLTSMADFLDEENETILKSVTGLIEPLILISLGVVVGLVATSMFMPLFDLTGMAGNAGGGGAP